MLGEAIVEHLRPIQMRYTEIMDDPAYLHSVLKQGAEEANVVADETLFKARKALGFLEYNDVC